MRRLAGRKARPDQPETSALPARTQSPSITSAQEDFRRDPESRWHRAVQSGGIRIRPDGPPPRAVHVDEVVQALPVSRRRPRRPADASLTTRIARPGGYPLRASIPTSRRNTASGVPPRSVRSFRSTRARAVAASVSDQGRRAPRRPPRSSTPLRRSSTARARRARPLPWCRLVTQAAGEGPVVDDADLAVALQHLGGHLVGDSALTQGGGQLRPRAGSHREQAQADLPGPLGRVGRGPVGLATRRRAVRAARPAARPTVALPGRDPPGRGRPGRGPPGRPSGPPRAAGAEPRPSPGRCARAVGRSPGSADARPSA